jgi:hypothetical protein
MGDGPPRHPAGAGPGCNGAPGTTTRRRIPHGPLDSPVAVTVRRWENVSVASRGGCRTSKSEKYWSAE